MGQTKKWLVFERNCIYTPTTNKDSVFIVVPLYKSQLSQKQDNIFPYKSYRCRQLFFHCRHLFLFAGDNFVSHLSFHIYFHAVYKVYAFHKSFDKRLAFVHFH